jgi:RHS repeat-associated protein
MTGHVADVDSGLVYMQARYYDPTIARFLSADPVTPFQNSRLNFQRYSYAADNPFAYHDPTGKQIHADQPDVGRGDCAQAFICGEKSTLPSDVQLDAEEYASSHVASWLRSMWRGQAAHKVIEADLKRAGRAKGYEVEVEHSFETAAGGRLRIDVMMRKSAKEAWSIFEIKPANDKAASAGYSQVTRYDSEMSRAGEMSKVGSWSYFFSEPYRSTTVPSIVIGPMDFGGTYIYGPDESWRGVITYQTADSAPHP